MSKRQVFKMDVFIGPAFRKYYQQFPIVVVDVGAAGGLEERWEAAEQYLSVIGFEPNNQSFAELVKSHAGGNRRYFNTALHNEKANVTFYVTKAPNASSIFKPDQPFVDKFPQPQRYEIEETLEIAADTLDNQAKEHGIQNVDFIKLDTQGSELLILQGAAKLLGSDVFGIEAEIGFAPRYLNQPLFSDVDSFLRQFQFQLFDIKPVYVKRTAGLKFGGPKGQLITGDALFFRTPESFVAMLDRLQEEAAKKSKVLNALSICFVYGFLDYALECFDAVSDLFSKEEQQLLVRHIKSNVVLSNRIPKFVRGRTRLATVLHRLWMTIQSHDQGYAPAGRWLGNWQ